MIATKLKIRVYGDPCLRKKSKPVATVTPAHRLLFDSMIETMYQAQGMGLAAPQVGINERFFVSDTGAGAVIVINPAVVETEGSAALDEGCLSVPGITVPIARAEKITLRYVNEYGAERKEIFVGMMARAMLHEMDHLDGKLIVDYTSSEVSRKIKPASHGHIRG
jgi:peptide deformylase